MRKLYESTFTQVLTSPKVRGRGFVKAVTEESEFGSQVSKAVSAPVKRGHKRMAPRASELGVKPKLGTGSTKLVMYVPSTTSRKECTQPKKRCKRNSSS